MSLRLAAVVLLFISTRVSAQQLAAQSLQRLKAATVYVEAGRGTGTAFLFKKKGTTGYLLTCQHVVEGEKHVRVVFNAGTAQEKVVTARVSADDEYLDLACCVVENVTDLPEPLAMLGRTECREDDPLYVAGFPFGKALAAGNRRPEITVTVAKAATLRRDDFGRITVVQLSGEVNPGNSGGPVVDASGKIVGVTAAKIKDTQVAFAVSGECVRQFLLGRAHSIRFTQASKTPGNVKYNVQLNLTDPIQSIKSAGIAWGRVNNIENTNEPKDETGWRKASAAMKEAPLKVDGANGLASGVVEMNRVASDPPSDVLVYQVYWVQGDGTKVWSEPALQDFEFEFQPSDRNRRPTRPKDWTLAPTAMDSAALPLAPAARLGISATIGGLAYSKTASRLFVLDLSHGELLKLTPDPLAIESRLDLGLDALAMAMSPDEKTLYVVSRAVKIDPVSGVPTPFAQVRAVDPATLAVARKFEAPTDPFDIAANDAGAVYVSGNPGLVLTDGRTGETSVHYKGLAMNVLMNIHPDQGRLYFSSQSASDAACLRPELWLEGERLPVHRGRNPDRVPLGGRIVTSPDGKRLVSMFGSIARLSLAPALDLAPVGEIEPWMSFAYSSDGKTAWGAGADGSLRAYAGADLQARKCWNLGLLCTHLASDPSGKVLFAAVSGIPKDWRPEAASTILLTRRLPAGDLAVIRIPN